MPETPPELVVARFHLERLAARAKDALEMFDAGHYEESWPYVKEARRHTNVLLGLNREAKARAADEAQDGGSDAAV